ncbi:hypothetical protein Celaphus_00009117, partial [Cervus elaphus hippelaphus]
MEDMQRQLNLMQGALSHRKNLSDRELVRYASGGLALQGIYKTSDQRCLIQKKEELLCVPKEFVLCGPEQGTRMETKEFTSSEEECMFTQTIEKLGFSVTALAKGGGWGVSLEAGMDQSMHSESKKIQQSHSKHSYFCSTKFSYMPLASFHFPIDKLQLSNAALQELKCIEDLLGQSEDPEKPGLLRHRTEAFFQRFGSHANQGPLHLGGIYWWKAISEGFQKEQLAEVKQKAAEALAIYISGSYSGFGVNIGTGMDMSDSHSKKASQRTTFQNLQTKVQLSVAQTGGPPEANGFLDWKAGLVAHNQTWCVIDRGLQLVPVWDIVLSKHRSDFKDPLKVVNCLKDNYTVLTELTAQIQEGELLRIEKEVRMFLEDVKFWKVFDPEEQLKRLINFMQRLSQKTNSYTTWTNICLKDLGLQNFLVSTVNFCKKSSIYETKFIKSQLSRLLDPHIYKVKNFPQGDSIMQWIFQSEPKEDNIHITQFSELIEMFKKAQNDLMEVKTNSESTELVEEAQRKLTYEVSLSLRSFLKYLRKTGKPDTYILVLFIAAGAGYHVVDNIFQYLLGHDELDFLLDKMQTAQNKYQELKKICNYRAQAFLVLTGLTARAGNKALSPDEKTQRLALIKHHMGQSLTKEVVYVLTKLGDHDWEYLEKDLRLLIYGNYEATVSSLQVEEVRKQLQNVFHEKKELHEPYDNKNKKEEVIENGAFQDLLERLGLQHYYPRKMNRANCQLIHKTSVYNTQPCSERELPFYFLQKLLMLDYGLRYLIIKHEEYTENQVYSSTSNQEKKAFDPYKDLLEDSVSPTKPSAATNVRPYVHPMDIQMAILHCADDFARQYILDKLSICQFALPLLIPNPCNAQIEFSLWSLSQIRRSWQQEGKSTKGEKDNYMNHRMVHVSVPIVSFIRVGNGFSASKSQIMNCLLRATSIKTFVDFLWNKLTPAVSSTIRKNMALKIAGDIRTTCRAFNENRANLEKHILISLAEEENFDNYWQYLIQPESFFKNYIENHVKRYFSDTGSKKIKTFLQISLHDIRNVILSAIHASTAKAKGKSSTVSGWLDLFCDHLGSNLIFPRKNLISIEHQEIKDIEFLKEAMSKALDPEMKKVEQNCLSRFVEMIPEIQKMLSEHLCGCWKQCPFCKAICTNTIPTHEGDHSVPFHRPQALGGWWWSQTDNFSIDYCTSLVASDCNFILNDGRRFPYKTYRQAGGEYATWSITPDTSTQPYWKWFFCHFRSKLEEKYHKKFINKGEIPDAWKKITKQDNVGEVTAKDKIMDGRRRLEQRLDEMAAIAAEEEQCSDVTCFGDVIKFDANTHVYYFAHLWNGNPPMAPPNPRYSHNVQELKNRILMTAQQESRGSIMKISDVKFRVQDLWRALLNENFIFSFRNTQEVMAMSKLETMYNSWTWELRSHVQKLQDQLINQIQNGKIQTLKTYALEAPVTEIYEAIKQKLEKYFNEDPDREVLVQWKGNFENKLITLKDALILDGQRKAKELISFKKSQDKLDNKKSGYEKELLEKSRNLALSLKSTELSEKELHQKFNPLWEKWVNDVSSSLPQATEPTIKEESKHILFEHFKKEKDIINTVKNYSGEEFEINYDKHVKMNRKYLGLSTKTIDAQDKHSIGMTTECIISKVNTTVNKISQQKHDYNPTYFHEILRIIDEE